MDRIGKIFESEGKWTPVSRAKAERHWKFRGRDGNPWLGALKIETLAGARNRYTATVTVARAG
jgi:hypothetical protein